MPGTVAPNEMPIAITTSTVARSRLGVNSAFSAMTFGNTPPRPKPLRKRNHRRSCKLVAQAQANVVTPTKIKLVMIAKRRPNRSPK